MISVRSIISLFSAIVVFATFPITSPTIHAQELLPLGPPPDSATITLAPAISYPGGSVLGLGGGSSLYRGFNKDFDTTFSIGSEYVSKYAKVAHDTLRFDYTYTYKNVPSLSYLRKLGLFPDAVEFLDSMKVAKLKMVYAPYDLFYMQTGAMETYYEYDWGAPYHHSEWCVRNPGLTFQELPNRYAQAGIFADAAHDSTNVGKRMVGRPFFTSYALYDNAGANWYDSLGYSPTAKANAIATYDLTITVQADALSDPTISNSAVFAKVYLYVRDTTAQTISGTTGGVGYPSPCRCNFIRLYDSILFTKADYFNPSRAVMDSTVGSKYREITKLFHKPVGHTYSVGGTSVTMTGMWADSTLVNGVWHHDTLDLTGAKAFTAYNAGANTTSYIPPSGAWVGWPFQSPRFLRYCDTLRKALVARGVMDPATIDITHPDSGVAQYSDITYDVYTTGLVPLTFLRARVAPHMLSMLRLDSMNRFINRNIDEFYGDTDQVFRDNLLHFSLGDEWVLQLSDSYRLIGSRVLRRILYNDSVHAITTDNRGTFVNPIYEFSTLRLTSGDCDTTDIKMIHMMLGQWYNLPPRFPVYYANPDRMHGSDALNNLFNKQTGIAYNNLTAAANYDSSAQDIWRDHIGRGEDLLTTARRQFKHLSAQSLPVSINVNVGGEFQSVDNAYQVSLRQWKIKPATPEEITCQAWLALNQGLDGILYSDTQYDGDNVGIVRAATGEHTTEYYDSTVQNWTEHNTALPTMWLGLNSRFNAVRKMNDTLVKVILPVFTKLNREGIRMTVADSNAHFWAVPVLDTLYTRKAKRYDRSGGTYADSVNILTPGNAYDPKSETFIEASLFAPGKYDTNRTSVYMILTNKRCWPTDTTHYTSYVDSLCNAAGLGTNETVGLGAIDVRRPIIKLKAMSIMADSFQIKRIGTSIWQMVGALDTVPLDWLEPGWGAMYQIRPVLRGVSPLAIGYNNGVHTENPSKLAALKERLIVYERDSAVWLRTVDALGRWSGERLISDATDTARVAGSSPKRRKANNMFPVLGTVRNGSALLVAWEREIDSAGGKRATTEARYFPQLPQRSALNVTGETRLRLSSSRVAASTHLTPAVTGVDSGWVVAWATPPNGIEVVAVRDHNTPVANDISAVSRVKVTPADLGIPGGSFDSLAAFPTLAYVRQTYRKSGMPSFWQAHLAFQQTTQAGWSATGIYYKTIGFKFPQGGGQPLLDVSLPTENVSVNLSGCNHQHPCIAVDSFRLGVAFETRYDIYRGMLSPSSTGQVVRLRFRNEFNGRAPATPWNTTIYSWGDSAGSNEYPSLTQFPALSLGQLQTGKWGVVAGGMAWQRWVSRKDSTQQLLYRYGDSLPYSLPNGKFPTMMLVPYIHNVLMNVPQPFSYTSTFYRGDDSSRFVMRHPLVDSAWYFHAAIENGPAGWNNSFATGRLNQNQIYSHFVMGKARAFPSECLRAGLSAGIIIDPLTRGPVPPDFSPAHSDSTQPGLPANFFPKDSTTTAWNRDTAGALLPIVYTSAFSAGGPVKVHEYFVGSDSLVEWLNAAPYDSMLHSSGDIRLRTQLVRISDSVVIWSGPWSSARTIGSGVIDDALSIPVDSVATTGTQVMVRLFAAPTTGLTYEIEGGFQFLADSSVTGPAEVFYKTISPELPQEAPSSSTSGLRLNIIPNPARDEAELRVGIAAAGQIGISIYDVQGRLVHTFPLTAVSSPGEYGVHIDLSNLSSGTYTVYVKSGHEQGTLQLVVVR